MYYHVRVTQKSNVRAEVKLDLSREQLQTQIIKPYEQGEPLIINGRTILPDEIERVQVSVSEEDSSRTIPEIEEERRRGQITVIGGPSTSYLVAARGRDATDEFITGAPGHKKNLLMEVTTKTTQSAKKVFIVHGHDHLLKTELEIFLRDIGLEPIVLHREADEGLTIIEKFEKHSDVGYAFVLLTPDDASYATAELEKQEENRTVEFRARQNVIFEFGYFVGRLGRSGVCCIYKDRTTLPTDVSGLIYKRVRDRLEEIGYNLIKELQAAGYKLTLNN